MINALWLVAKSDSDVWRSLVTLNKEFAQIFCFQNYEQEFRTVNVSDIGTTYSLDGCRHRSDGPAIIYKNGDTYWYRSGKLHRIGGPAIDTALLRMWIISGKRHRLDGPASENLGPDILGNDPSTYWINGRQLTKENFDIRIAFYKKIQIYDDMLYNRFPEEHIMLSFPFNDAIF